MVLLLHILLASASLTHTTYLVAKPSRSALPYSYALLALTILSGVAEVAVKPASLTQACVSGLVYAGVVCGGILVARKRLVQA